MRSGKASTWTPTTKKVAGTWNRARTSRKRPVYGEGPSSKVSATARSAAAGPSGTNRTEASLCETAPRAATERPGMRSTKNCGFAGRPRVAGATSNVSRSRRSAAPRTPTRSPARCPSTSSRLPAGGSRPNRRTALPSVVPSPTAACRPATEIGMVGLPVATVTHTPAVAPATTAAARPNRTHRAYRRSLRAFLLAELARRVAEPRPVAS